MRVHVINRKDNLREPRANELLREWAYFVSPDERIEGGPVNVLGQNVQRWHRPH